MGEQLIMPGIAPKLPLAPDSGDGTHSLTKGLNENVKQNLKLLILTCPGERVMMPSFGVGLKRWLFEQNTNQAKGEIQGMIKSQISKHMPFVDLIDVIITDEVTEAGASKTNFIKVSVHYRVRAAGYVDVLDLSVAPF
jgi:phage baseplate assembly protein W